VYIDNEYGMYVQQLASPVVYADRAGGRAEGANIKMRKSETSQERLVCHTPGKEEVEVLRQRLGLLSGMDRALMTMYLDKGARLGQLAELLGINRTSVARRIRRLTRRLIDERYMVCVQNRSRLTPLQLRILRDHLLHGLPLRRIARNLGLSYYVVRKNMHKTFEMTTRVRQSVATGNERLTTGD
jgi:predicted DNA-binding protein YlxM (UPF0122 family)